MVETNSRETYRYEIKVKGHVIGNRIKAFEGFQLKLTPDGHTIISGPTMDQAALFGVLIRIRDYGLPLVSVMRQEPVNGRNDQLVNRKTKNV